VDKSDTPPPPRRDLLVLLLAAGALFTASIGRLSLTALDDCFYARKGVEMARSGSFFTVTWNGSVTTQHPPLGFWILGRSFAALGENDFAARLPSVLMALGILLGAYRIGAELLDHRAGVTAVALLLASPNFVANARRAMLDVQLAFWVVLAILVLLEGRRRPWAHALLAVPLGAAVLTKSVLGLLPLVLLFAAAPFSPTVRGWLARGWIWLGIAGGLALGASWIVHQWLTFGTDTVMVHLHEELLRRSTAPLSLLRRFTDYPKVLIESFEPVAPLAVGGALLVARGRREGRGDLGLLLPLWAFLPVIVYSFSNARSPRYLFPIFPGLALCAGLFLEEKWPRGAAVLRRAVVPALALVAAAVFWVRPSLLSERGTAVFKAEAPRLRQWNPEREAVAYVGTSYFGIANPLLYYAEIAVEPPGATLEQSVAHARASRSRLLFADRNRVEDVRSRAGEVEVLLEGPSWLLLRVSPA
jgi:4-amino-4-deoxy-L-arabinose transferase-like glycosyltransferase